MNNKKKIVQLSIFLIKKEYTFKDIIKEDEHLEPHEITIPDCEKGTLYIKKSMRDTPKWSSFFEDKSITRFLGATSNVSAVLILKVSDRYFALTFGPTGRFLLQNNIYENRFGLHVALNSVTRTSIKCVDKQSLDTINHTRIQSVKETTVDQFGIDIEQDMLKSIVGTPDDSHIGNRMTGTDSLSVSVRMDLSDLKSLLVAYMDKFERDLSTTDYQWVNNIFIVKNLSITSELDKLLIDEFNKLLIEGFDRKNYSKLWLAIPEIIQWDQVKGFIFEAGNEELCPDINLEKFLSTIKKGQQVTLKILKGRNVYCADEDHKKTFKSWPIHKCIYFETIYDDNTYIFNDAKWFSVNSNFVEKTDIDFKKIIKSKLNLPKYEGGGEGRYNSSVAEQFPEEYALLDGKVIHHGGRHGQVEVCDLFSKNKHLIHVKLYGKSSVLSHLISQGFVSGHLIQLDADFRKKVKDKLPNSYKDLIEVGPRPAEGDFTIVFAIISDSGGDDLHLPFFSRVNINNATNILKGFGYKVELLKIKRDPQK